jgi:hypothetical protein
MVDASEIAFVAVFLASDKARTVSGELVAATGGQGGWYFTKQRFLIAYPLIFFNVVTGPALGLICNLFRDRCRTTVCLAQRISTLTARIVDMHCGNE